jgi:hypothetical protein
VHGKPRIKLSLTEEAPLSTTKSDGIWIVQLMDETNTDIISVFEYVILQTKYHAVDEALIVAWLPPDARREVLRWLEQERNAQQEDDDAGPL